MIFQKLLEQPVETNIHICPGLFVKHSVFEEGSFIPQHSHEYPHLTVVASGAVRAWKDDVLLGDFTAPAGIVIEAGTKHLFLALAPAAVLCIHRVDEDGDPSVLDEHQIVGGA